MPKADLGAGSGIGQSSAPTMLGRWGELTSPRGFMAVLSIMIAVYVPTATFGYSQSVDSAMTAFSSWSLAERGTFDLSDVREQVVGNDVAATQTVDVDGHLYTNRFPGAIFAGVPFYAAHAWTQGGSELPALPMGGLAAATITALAVAVLHLVFRQVAPSRTSLVAAIAFGLGTGTWSVSADALWTHGPAQLWLALGMLALAHGVYATSGWAWGLALLTRPHLGVAAAAAGLSESRAQRSVKPAMRVALTTSVGLVAWLLYGRLLFGEWTLFGGYVGRTGLPGNQADQPISSVFVNIWWMIFHPRRGFLLFTPWLVWLVPALPRAWRSAKSWVRSSALAGIAYLVAQAYINDWEGGDTFWAYRYPIETLTLLAPLLLVTYQQLSLTRRRFVVVLIGVSVALQVPGAVLEFNS